MEKQVLKGANMDFNILQVQEPTEENLPDKAVDLDPERACRIIKRMFLSKVDDFKKQAISTRVTDPESQRLALDRAGQLKKMVKVLEKERHKLIDRPYTFVSTINSTIKAFKDRLDEGERALKSELSAYANTVRMEQLEAQRKINEATAQAQRILDERAAKANVPAPVITAPVVPKETVLRGTVGSTMSFRKESKFVLQNIALVPHEYLLINEVKLGQAVKAGIRTIPGFDFVEIEVPVIRA